MQYRKNIVLLKRGSQSNKNIFLVHEGTGRIESYFSLSALTKEFTIYAINLDERVGFTPKHISIEDLSASYIQQIKNIQPDGPYFIGGWSTGGLIAFEIVNQLEQDNNEISLCAMIDSPPPGYYPVKNSAGFSVESEMELIRQLLADQRLMNKLSSTTTVDEFWACMLSNLTAMQINKQLLLNSGEFEFSTIIPNAAELPLDELFCAINVIRTLQHARARYRPGRRLNTLAHQFIAVHSPLAKQPGWDQHCTKTKIYQVPGDHYSMLKAENIVSFAACFNAVLADLP